MSFDLLVSRRNVQVEVQQAFFRIESSVVWWRVVGNRQIQENEDMRRAPERVQLYGRMSEYFQQW